MTDYHLPNGVSALAARALVGRGGRGARDVRPSCPAAPSIAGWRRPAPAAACGSVSTGAWAMPGSTRSTSPASRPAAIAIVAIGKGLEPYDCYDTGVFAVSQPFFEALASSTAPR